MASKKRPGKQNVAIKQAAKKNLRHQKWSKDRSERVRDALNRDTDMLYNVLEKPSTVPPTTPRADPDALLAERMQGLGR